VAAAAGFPGRSDGRQGFEQGVNEIDADAVELDPVFLDELFGAVFVEVEDDGAAGGSGACNALHDAQEELGFLVSVGRKEVEAVGAVEVELEEVD